MSLIDYSYFIRKLSLSQANDTTGRSIITEFIYQYESEFLKKALCYELWKAFSDGIAGSGSAEERFEDLINGKEFEIGDKKYYWNGFKPTEGKKTPIANYVFYKFMEDKHSDNTNIGIVQSKAANAEVVPYQKKMYDAWNEMAVMMIDLKLFLDFNTEIYPEWKYCSCSEVYRTKNVLGI